MRLPSGLNAALVTAQLSWPMSGSPICLPLCGIPQPRRLVIRRGDDALPPGLNAALDTPHVLASSGSPIGLPLRGVPDARRLVYGRGDDVRAVGAERRSDDLALMTSEQARPSVDRSRHPKSVRFCRRRSDNPLAIEAERRTLHTPSVACKRLTDRLAGRRVPHPSGSAKDAVTIRRPSGLNAALLTSPSCPLSGSPTGRPVAASHNCAVSS